MRFDSHVIRLLDASVALVNATTPGSVGASALTRPEGSALVDAVAGALAGEGYEPRVSPAEAEALADLAARLRPVFEAAEAGDLAVAAARVNDLLDATAARPRLDHTETGWDLHFHGPDDGLVHGWGAGCASGLALALGSDLAGRLGICAAPVCDRVYVDTSRNAGRRFCSARCQSRVKAAAHRARGRA